MRPLMTTLLILHSLGCEGSVCGHVVPADAGRDAAFPGRDAAADAAVEPATDASLDAEVPGLDAEPDTPPTRCPVSPSGPPQAVPPAGPPNREALVQAVADEHPDWVANSCVDTGGDNEFLFEVVRRLREEDDRWGFNWKRGNEGDLSQDVVDYLWGEGACEGNVDVYIIDVIGAHCSADAGPAWIDVTQATADAGTIGRWTLAGQDI